MKNTALVTIKQETCADMHKVIQRVRGLNIFIRKKSALIRRLFKETVVLSQTDLKTGEHIKKTGQSFTLRNDGQQKRRVCAGI